MCKYCEKEAHNELAKIAVKCGQLGDIEITLDMDGEEDMGDHIVEPMLFIDACHSYDIDLDSFKGIDIKYCPFCGRKL